MLLSFFLHLYNLGQEKGRFLGFFLNIPGESGHLFYTKNLNYSPLYQNGDTVLSQGIVKNSDGLLRFFGVTILPQQLFKLADGFMHAL